MRKKRKTGGMGVMAYNETKRRNNKKYDDKTYKTIAVRLRFEDDADLIASYEEARKNGITSREWLRTLSK